MPDVTAPRLGSSLQVLVLAALCFDATYGAAIAAQVLPSHFDTTYRDFAIRLLNYRKRYHRPPGRGQLEHLIEQVRTGSDDRARMLKQRVLPQLLAEADGLNAEYVAAQVQNFVRRQVLKGAIIEAGDRYNQDDDDLVEDVERIFHKALVYRSNTFDAGVRLTSPEVLAFSEESKEEIIPLGIPEIDRLGIGMAPKELLLYIGPKGTGKTWFCVHCGRQALMQGRKVVHYSLEMDELKVSRRYYQGLFSVARNKERIRQTLLEFDELGRLAGFDTRSVRPSIAFSDEDDRRKLRRKLARFGTRLDNLVIKAFPTGQATIEMFEGHLDYLENAQRFVPSVMIVDYPDLMRADSKTYRLDIGKNMENLRGLAVRRNMALVAPTQGTRKTMRATRVRSSDVAEDIRKVNAADNVFAYSQTEQEKELGLARLSVEHARDTSGDTSVLLAQSYDTGQYVMRSALIQKAYWDKLKSLKGSKDDDDEDTEL